MISTVKSMWPTPAQIIYNSSLSQRVIPSTARIVSNKKQIKGTF